MVRELSTILFACLLVSGIVHPQSAEQKCGTFAVVRSFEQARTAGTEAPLTSRTEMQTSVLSKGGHFRIHFDTAGVHQPAFVTVSVVNGIKTVTRVPNTYKAYIDTLAALFDSVWRAEVDGFGFAAPPSDNGRGGGNEYDIYVLDLSAGFFGVTNPEYDLPTGPSKSNQQYASFIEFENDFGSGYRTNGIEAMMATAAHEFHHAMQIGSYGMWESNHFYFYELSAEAMENTVFRHAKDYLFDLRTYFTNIASTSLFTQPTGFTTAGYERAIWGLFLIKKFGMGVMREMWEEVGQRRPIQAMDTVLNSRSTSIEREFANFTYWNFFTGYRADTVKYYTDGRNYPMVPFIRTVTATSAPQSIALTVRSFTGNYVKAVSSSDSAFMVLSNTDLVDAIANAQNVYAGTLSFATNEGDGYIPVSSGIFARFTPADAKNWSFISMAVNSKPFCFPNPFRPAESSLLISLNGVGVSDALTLTIISAVSADLIYQHKAEYGTFSGTQYAEWKGRDNTGAFVASGVYLYFLSDGQRTVKGKFAVIR